MFGAYEIECEGRKYVGNVVLREHHIFDYDGNFYLVDVDSVTAQPISPRTAAMIDRVGACSGGLVPEAAMAELRRLKLVAGDARRTPETLPEDKTGAADANNIFPVVSIALFLAQECNMRCVYCYGDGGSYAGEGLMQEETALAAVDWLIENSKGVERIHISFFGGEPLLNFPLLKKVVAYAKEQAFESGKQVAFGITTNGSLLTDETIAFLKAEKVLPVISFDGPPEIQDRQRPFRGGRGSYATVRAKVQKLRAAFPDLTARGTVWGDTDPFRVKAGMEEAGFAAWILARASPVILKGPSEGAAPDGGGEAALERMLAYNRREIDLLLAAIRDRKLDKDAPPALLRFMKGIASGKKRHHGCGIGKAMAAVAVNGDIYPCHRFAGQAEVRLGHIADYRPEGLNDYHRAVVDRLPECRECWARYACGGGCFYHNKAHTGDMHRPDALDCRERKAVIEGVLQAWCRLDDTGRAYLTEFLKAFDPEPRP